MFEQCRTAWNFSQGHLVRSVPRQSLCMPKGYVSELLGLFSGNPSGQFYGILIIILASALPLANSSNKQ